MNSISPPCCNCCELPLGLSTGKNCQRCGYPLDPLKEEQFLKDFVQNLERAALYGGEYIPVITLVARYQRRLQELAEAKEKAAQQRVVHAQQEQWMQTQQFKTASVPMQTPISALPVAGPP